LALLTALEFLTIFRLPLLRRRAADAVQIARSQGLFPLVGLLLGLMLVGLDRALAEVMPLPATAGLLVVALVVATGGLHLDGLADTCDGLFGGSSPPERLTIMRDSRVGSFGVLAVVCLLLLKWAIFLSLASPLRRGALLLAPALGRWAMVGAVAAWPYARSQGLGKTLHGVAWPLPTLTAAAIALAASLLLFPIWGAALFAFASLVGGVIALYSRGKLGGLTGDVYGAISECTEVAVLLAVAAGQETGHLEAWLWRG
jgi:adenosylcobinamide-GDP ribazoletransferase